MDLLNCSLTPGVVINAEDPKCLGRIKCAVPGIFDPSSMPEETLPWVYPLTMTGYQSFSKLCNGSKVWVLENKDNLNEFWYLPMPEFITPSGSFITENYKNDPDLLLSRSNGSTNAQIMYDSKNGIKQTISNNLIQLEPKAKITIKSDEALITLTGNKVYTGKNEAYEPAVMGNKLTELLSKLGMAMSNLATSASSSPFTIHLNSGFLDAETHLSACEQILAKNTFLN